MLCQFLVYRKVIQLCIYLYSFFSHIDYHKILSRFPVDPFWSSILQIVMCVCLSQAPDLSLSTPPSFPFVAPHSSTLAWKIPWMEEPGGPQSMGSLRVGQDSATSLSLFTFLHWRRQWQPTPVFLPGESQGWGSLVGCHLWGLTESDTTEATQQQQQQQT